MPRFTSIVLTPVHAGAIKFDLEAKDMFEVGHGMFLELDIERCIFSNKCSIKAHVPANEGNQSARNQCESRYQHLC